MKNKFKIPIVILVLSLILIILDQVSKNFIEGEGCFFIFCLSHTINYGGAFSLPIGFIILITVSILVALVSFVLIFISKSPKIKIALSFIFAGSIGNLIDRIFLGHVRDFLSFSFMLSTKFNFADVFNLVGVLLLIVFLFMGEK